LVTFLIDDSGSMEWKAGCACEGASCSECDPDCSTGGRNRWHELLGVMTGSYESFECVPKDRTLDNGASFDLGYPRRDYPLGPNVQQRADGAFDRYASRVQFGLATFDAVRTYSGHSDLVELSTFDSAQSDGAAGQYSFAGGGPSGPRVRPDGSVVGKLFYPGLDHTSIIDTGIVRPGVLEGGLILPSATADAQSTLDQIKRELHHVRPFGSTPIASALDDLSAAYDGSADHSLILITDGYPDDDFRVHPTPGCNCVEEGTCPANVDPARMSCPYPAAEDAARHLHCGFDADSCDGPVAKLLIIGYSISDETARSALDNLAAAGGGHTFYASDAGELGRAVNAALDEVLADAAR
jgi:hypothetical protein